jgi:hypothetical protein
MAFPWYGVHGTPRGVNDYDTALAAWEKGKMWVGEPSNHKRFGDSYKKYNRIVKHDDDSIAFRYHKTDVVTYHTDGLIRVIGWDSISTTAFAETFTPSDVLFDMTCGGAYENLHMCKVRTPGEPAAYNAPGRYYVIDGHIDLRRGTDGKLHASHIGEWEWHEYVQPRHRMALKASGYHEFAAWLKMAMRMRAWPEHKDQAQHYGEVVDKLKDRSRWHEFLGAEFYQVKVRHHRHWTSTLSPEDQITATIAYTLKYVRESISRVQGTARVTTYAFLETRDDVRRCMASHKAIPWAKEEA